MELHVVRRILRPAFNPGLRNCGWCEKLPKRVDDMNESETSECLRKLAEGG